MSHSGLLTSPENPIVSIEWDMLALNGSTKSDLWGVSAIWGLDNERFTMGINGANRLTVRNAMIGTVVTSTAVNRNQWNRYRMDLNYETDQASAYFNGTFIGQWQMLGGPNEHTGTALFNRAFGANDGAIYDGLSITGGSAPVPEPATIVGASVGLLALIQRKRNR